MSGLKSKGQSHKTGLSFVPHDPHRGAGRLALLQLLLALLTQLSAVGFPSYNIALGMLGWHCRHTLTRKALFLYLTLLPFSVVTDLTFVGLWATGSVYESPTDMNILTCATPSNSGFPNCKTNQFCLTMLILCDFTKLVSIVITYRMYLTAKSEDETQCKSGIATVKKKTKKRAAVADETSLRLSEQSEIDESSVLASSERENLSQDDQTDNALSTGESHLEWNSGAYTISQEDTAYAQDYRYLQHLAYSHSGSTNALSSNYQGIDTDGPSQPSSSPHSGYAQSYSVSAYQRGH